MVSSLSASSDCSDEVLDYMARNTMLDTVPKLYSFQMSRILFGPFLYSFLLAKNLSPSVSNLDVCRSLPLLLKNAVDIRCVVLLAIFISVGREYDHRGAGAIVHELQKLEHVRGD